MYAQIYSFQWIFPFNYNNEDNDTEDNAIRTNNIKAKIDKTRENCRYMLRGD